MTREAKETYLLTSPEGSSQQQSTSAMCISVLQLRWVPNLRGCQLFASYDLQAKEITATVGQAFELAYKKFLETKQLKETQAKPAEEENTGL